jgi:hypothetical protein
MSYRTDVEYMSRTSTSSNTFRQNKMTLTTILLRAHCLQTCLPLSSTHPCPQYEGPRAAGCSCCNIHEANQSAFNDHSPAAISRYRGLRHCSPRASKSWSVPNAPRNEITFIMSIWDGVNRDAMYQNLRSLTLNGKYQHESKLTGISLHESSVDHGESYVLSPQDERQLADDFAFLACVTKEPRAVSAAAVHTVLTPPHIVITIAANEGIHTSVGEKLREILEALRHRANRVSSQNDTLSICRNIIINLHRQRILTRLASIKVRSYWSD